MHSNAKHLPCPKHEKQGDFKVIQIDYVFRSKCSVCGKMGPKRKTLHGSIMAWNEIIGNEMKIKKWIKWYIQK